MVLIAMILKRGKMANIVFVHGGFHGGWCWAKVAKILRSQGHDVFTPTLTGLGERVHLLSQSIGLDTHINDIVNVIRYEELHDVILVGHSYGGMVVGCVADQMADRIQSIIYLDAFIPKNGQNMFADQIERARTELEELAREKGDGWWVPPVNPKGKILGLTNEEEISWLSRCLTAHPLKTFTDIAKLDGNTNEIDKYYIYCTQKPHGSSFKKYADEARISPEWTLFEIDAHHDPMISVPEELCELIKKTNRRPDV
jgi:pimeloyl-ACP methyl ester carboxylesterase